MSKTVHDGRLVGIRRKTLTMAISRHPGSDYATQIRGLAALAVFGVHANALAPILNHPRMTDGGLERVLTNFSNFGAAGPVLAGSTLSWVALEKPMTSFFRTKKPKRPRSN